ncbi:acetate/propionate family kinase [Asticcacaulis machinosus]|uniref:Acetate kinase n=1 Tax=Asticcacaulis machinosus TaxID=2984211 RepID=A0ABT5HMN8_9CAUL|nr:acetate/propionate family kinase [Asticcacaulis machinosus]MDC7677505.1 acetate/propionate family kinase [Asticcacaulis machinosus]
MIEALLVLNAGSSSLKFQVFGYQRLTVLAEGKVVRIGAEAHLSARAGTDALNRDLTIGADHEAALKAVLEFIDLHDDNWRVRGVAHRIVHGGTAYTEPVLVSPQVMRDLEALIPLAPLHQPHNLAAIAASEQLVGNVPDVACFDTAFHAHHDERFSRFAIPRDLHDQGVRRYGFHGLSYAWIARELAQHHPRLHGGRVIAAHLGNGASLCALSGGKSVDTTMGMTALDGLPMGTRAGAIDAGAVIYMMRDLGMGIEGAETMLYEQSGLLGLSGLSNDVEALMTSTAPDAAFALDYFALKVAQFAAALATSMGGLDGFVFTGGIGEHAEPVRRAVMNHLRFLGNFEVLVITANEEREMAIQSRAVLAQADQEGL